MASLRQGVAFFLPARRNSVFPDRLTNELEHLPIARVILPGPAGLDLPPSACFAGQGAKENPALLGGGRLTRAKSGWEASAWPNCLRTWARSCTMAWGFRSLLGFAVCIVERAQNLPGPEGGFSCEGGIDGGLDGFDRFRPRQNCDFNQPIPIIPFLASGRACKECQKPEKHVKSNVKGTSPGLQKPMHDEILLKTFWCIVARRLSIGYNSKSEGTCFLFCLASETIATGNGVEDCRSIRDICGCFATRRSLVWRSEVSGRFHRIVSQTCGLRQPGGRIAVCPLGDEDSFGQGTCQRGSSRWQLMSMRRNSRKS